MIPLTHVYVADYDSHEKNLGKDGHNAQHGADVQHPSIFHGATPTCPLKILHVLKSQTVHVTRHLLHASVSRRLIEAFDADVVHLHANQIARYTSALISHAPTPTFTQASPANACETRRTLVVHAGAKDHVNALGSTARQGHAASHGVEPLDCRCPRRRIPAPARPRREVHAGVILYAHRVETSLYLGICGFKARWRRLQSGKELVPLPQAAQVLVVPARTWAPNQTLLVGLLLETGRGR